MANLSAAPDSSSHPQWCNPFECHESDVDTAHASQPVTFRTRNAVITLTCVSTDCDTPELRLAVIDLTVTDGDSSTYLHPDELRRLHAALGVEIGRLTYLSAPVTRRLPMAGDAA